MRRVYFLSDFGLEDPYVGVVKAVLKSRAPGVEIVDLAHDLPPQDLRRAAYALYEALPYLEPGAILLAVVDPGVGSDRRAITALGERLYVGPDNGLFTLAWLLDPPRKAHILSLAAASATFHGRDLFAPATAHLALRLPMDSLGPSLDPMNLLRLPLVLSEREGEILTFDRFGNAITTLTQAPPGGWVRVKSRRIPIRKTYAEAPPGEALAYLGSSGLLEIGVNRGNARETLGLREGERVVLEQGL
ncbi:MAG: SAM hydrolase/SAM-dependent halogenase family protein [Thermaceae bacterium]